MRKLSLTMVLLVMSGVVSAATYTASTPYGETHGITKFKLYSYTKRVAEKSAGDIKFDVHSGGVLLPAKSALSGITNGVAQYGHVTGAYVPADLRYDNVLNDLAFVANDPLAAAIAVTEVKLTNKLLQKEYKDHKVVFGSSYSMTNYYVICRNEVSTPDALKSKRVRTGSTAQIQWTQSMGGVPVSVPATEIYTGLQRGNLDCALGDASFLTTSFKLQEVAKHVTLVSVGTHTSGGEFFEQKFWKGRSVEERKLLMSELAYAIAELQVEWDKEAKDALEEAKTNGVALHQPSADLQDAVTKFQGEFVKGLAKASMENRKVEDPSGMIDQYLETEQKWKELLKSVDRTDKAALAKLIKEKLYDGLDYQTYGL
ncbi:C4-dicarboxylate ABC transporter substrate-binding protein [Allopusillimonas ginsengisoli]|nr:C4-dicarboxylate ABC transporter substrate-binding protein [Allopusillimonas ginsengisoli]